MCPIPVENPFQEISIGRNQNKSDISQISVSDLTVCVGPFASTDQ